MYAIIRVRGSVNIKPKIKKTFELLNLASVNHMSIWPEEVANLKMLKKVENYATFGTISEKVLGEVITKKAKALTGELDVKQAIKTLASGKTIKEAGIKNCFKLNSPKKGYERKGIKKPFSIGGALGNRKDKMDELVKKMM
ncbi:MAG: 50S ribosomal protein L30 [Candidatus Diapherotrites archaeon]|jgi:large subunit ribosomal protein L30|uniref:50S ribosomal protein L30 n=1 Tax=Candidatus Iainarchaeum sp. TaxID=3101447 RepID=A0A8T5GF26_9ARCH|nr:50S ribosomal protein L30 [Candidatus Diapherotrites archaeon]MBT7241232.1 50S ribosomal protein L30 [Candidatus Diapherotrites archaeon]